jgi:hypothetical protein
MISLRWSLLLWLAPWLVIGPSALAQGDPHIGYIYPAGGRQGTTFEATIGGRYLNATNVYFSGTGVSATVLEQERQVTPTEQKELREALSKIQEKRKQGQRVTPEEAKSVENIRQRLDNFGRRLTNPSLGEFITLQVTVTPTAAPGNREIRLGTPAGLSNPLTFQVGELPELSKKDWKNVPKAKGSMDPELDPKPPEKNITLPVTLNGQIPPGGVDRYRFPAKEGRQVVVVVRARELIPYISDAVPGWFQATVALCDATGRELAYTDDYRFHPDPVLYYKVPAGGDYVLEIKDSLYRGREDFVYRVTVGELPFVTGVFPLGGKICTQTTLAASGWNLPFKQLPLDLMDKAPGIYPLSPERLANRVLVMADTLPEAFEKEPNNAADSAQPVTLPIIINGRIDQPGDMDVFRFEGKAGEQIVAEVHARRLDSPLDSMLAITDATGKQLAFNDDHEDKGSGLNTHHADSYLAVTLPATGFYFVHLGDTQHGGGEACSYRLRISAPRPDFELRVTPSSLNVHGGASVPLTVHALRKDGFTGAIALRLKDAPQGFTLSGAEVPEKQDQVRFTLNASPLSMMEPFALHIEGRASIQGREVVRSAVPADDMMQAFAYRHLVPAQELKVALFGRFRTGDAAQILSAMPVQIPADGTARIRVRLPAGPLVSKVEFELSEPPDGISIKEASPTEIVLQADAAKVKPGFKGNIIVKASAEPPAAAGTQPPPANRRRIPLGALPAIPYEIVPR